jgi:hypothetical protein
MEMYNRALSTRNAEDTVQDTESKELLLSKNAVSEFT